MDIEKEKDYIKFIKDKLKEINNQTIILNNRRDYFEMKLIKNKVCPECYGELKEEIIDVDISGVESYCYNCGFRDKWMIE